MNVMLSSLTIIHSIVSDGNLSYAWGDKDEVLQNREAFLAKHKLTVDECVALNLKHTTNIARVNRKDVGKGMYSLESGDTADAMITDDKLITLFLLTADCLPVVLYDDVHQAIGLVHLSKINAKENFIDKVITAMEKEYITRSDDLQIYIGPCIHKESYDFDLLGTTVDHMTARGVKEEMITISTIDTFTDPLYFSHRRSIRSGEPEGRFATVVTHK